MYISKNTQSILTRIIKDMLAGRELPNGMGYRLIGLKDKEIGVLARLLFDFTFDNGWSLDVGQAEGASECLSIYTTKKERAGFSPEYMALLRL